MGKEPGKRSLQTTAIRNGTGVGRENLGVLYKSQAQQALCPGVTNGLLASDCGQVLEMIGEGEDARVRGCRVRGGYACAEGSRRPRLKNLVFGLEAIAVGQESAVEPSLLRVPGDLCHCLQGTLLHATGPVSRRESVGQVQVVHVAAVVTRVPRRADGGSCGHRCRRMVRC